VFFTAEDRVDFRDLIRDLGHHVHAQVQLRQVGPRDQAKLIGGYGRCGRRLCCTSWLTTFPSISIRMAKEQSLPLNPAKISGQCGRLLCCLSYENDIYKHLKTELPKPDSWVTTPGGNARVVAVNVIKQVVTLQMEDFSVVEFSVTQLGIELGVTRPLPNGPAVAPLEVQMRTPAVEPRAGTRLGDAVVHTPPQRPGQPGQHDQSGGRRRNRGQGRPASETGASPIQLQPPRTDPMPASPAQPQPDGAQDGTGNKRRKRRRRGKKSE
jgi:hypothetical protein